MLEMKFIGTKDQLADLLTKTLPRWVFFYVVGKLMETLPIRLRGGVKGLLTTDVDQARLVSLLDN